MITNLKQLVRQEIKMIKKYATKEQKDRLNPADLMTRDQHRCIYGQMTGDCFNEEAKKLIMTCCPGGIYIQDMSNINGVVTDINCQVVATLAPRAFSPLETYIYSNPKDAKRIARYIKGWPFLILLKR